MYSGLLPKGLTEDDLSPDEEAEQEDVEERREGEKGSVENLSSAAKNTSSVVETQPINTANDADSDSPTCSMPGISQEMWQKFQDLRKQKDEIKMMKVPGRRRRRRHKKGAESEEPTETRECQVKREKPWDELQQYFGVNDRFHPPACSKPPPKSGLEKSIERAIAEGDIAKAEEMSDRLATREMAVKIAQAADCRDFVQRKQEEEALRAAQKRKKQIAWGFEAKKRWETKSNMGYM
ncbi:protein FAM204A isoform X2 [Acanthochromis polyacanthus]|uniref:protein FAM204A isoform X2 n=1 Tax=Acanthochromis polyacanthus TaxID=80966 RepID=UPI000B8F4630|nr:protein FAM204A isoform X2 [Acanthochromis polyacanthus]